jgi:hypothetical protein
VETLGGRRPLLLVGADRCLPDRVLGIVARGTQKLQGTLRPTEEDLGGPP